MEGRAAATGRGTLLDSVVGQYFADLLVEDSILLELKATEFLSQSHHSQCVHYLRATGHESACSQLRSPSAGGSAHRQSLLTALEE
jgi:hypothetical protein